MGELWTAAGVIRAADEDMLIGLTDLCVVQVGDQEFLTAAARGGGWVVGFELLSGSGALQERGGWRIPDHYLQLETTDLIEGPDGQLMLAGLAAEQMLGLPFLAPGNGSLFGAPVTFETASTSLSDVSLLTAGDGAGNSLVAFRSGGLAQLNLDGAGAAHLTSIALSSELQTAQVDALSWIEQGGRTFAVAAFGPNNTLVSLTGVPGGSLSVAAELSSGLEDGVWFSHPDAVAVATVGDSIFVVVGASGSGSLTVLAMDSTTGALSPVDHVLDTLETRFAGVTHIATAEYGGATYVVAAGADQGLSLLILMPDGHLRYLDSIAGTLDQPLRGITALEVVVTGQGLRVWAATETAPYLMEFSADLSGQGMQMTASQAGSALTGGEDADVLFGLEGNDTLIGGAGDDILRDGGGVDFLSGGAGADVFAFVADGERDVVTDFDIARDRLDLSEFEGSWDLQDLQVFSRSWGAELIYHGEVFEIRSLDGSSLHASDFGPAQFALFLDRVTPTPIEPGSGHLVGGSGPDLLIGSIEGDFLDGAGGDDRLSGRSGADTIYGGSGADIIVGGDGDDSLYGGAGNDVIYGDGASGLSWL